jgi:hypothetical protein
LNPVLPKRTFQYPQKIYVSKQQITNIKEPNPITEVPYKLEKMSQIT